MFFVFVISKNKNEDPCKISNINVVQSFWNFAQVKKNKPILTYEAKPRAMQRQQWLRRLKQLR